MPAEKVVTQLLLQSTRPQDLTEAYMPPQLLSSFRRCNKSRFIILRTQYLDTILNITAQHFWTANTYSSFIIKFFYLSQTKSIARVYFAPSSASSLFGSLDLLSAISGSLACCFFASPVTAPASKWQAYKEFFSNLTHRFKRNAAQSQPPLSTDFKSTTPTTFFQMPKAVMIQSNI